MPPETSTDRDRNEAASVWMHRGMDLLERGDADAETLRTAVGCFDEAITLRKTLPLDAEPFYRYGLSAGWINRGDAWARIEGGLDEALRSYEEAITLLETLELEDNPLYPRRLVITRLNHGVALQRRDGPGDLGRAATAFRRALDLLAWHPNFGPDHAQLHAAAWSNMAGALAASSGTSLDEARAAARRALALAKPLEAADLSAAGTALAARRTLCHLLVRDLGAGPNVAESLATEATDAVEEALAALRRTREQGQTGGEKPEQEFVRLGCRIYGALQPRFLAEFLVDHLALDAAEAGPLDPETFAAAQAAIWTALDRLQAGGVDPAGLLPQVRELNAAQEMLARRGRKTA